jgi:hypothetical protein
MSLTQQRLMMMNGSSDKGLRDRMNRRWPIPDRKEPKDDD